MSVSSPKPLLAILTGPPGSGKTTLAGKLAAELRCPLVSRDRLKEGALRTEGFEHATDRELAKRICNTFFLEVELLLRNNVSLVAEAAYQHKVWGPNLAPLLIIADVRIIVLHASAETIQRRRQEREIRDPKWLKYHPSPPEWEQEGGDYQAPALSVPTLELDTSDDNFTMRQLTKFLK